MNMVTLISPDNLSKNKPRNRRYLCLFVVLISVLILPASHARMYQWEQPQSGVIQLSGVAPAWYRSVNPGPRVLVFDNGRLVDDTGLRVSDAHRLALRQQALGEAAAEAGVTSVGEHGAENAQDDSLKLALTEAAKAGVDVEELAAEALEAAEAENPPTATTVQATVDELKALLSRWDIAKSSAARSVLDNPQQPNLPNAQAPNPVP